MNSIILYATAIILKIKPKLIRIIISSVIGSLYVIIVYVTEISNYTSIISKIFLAIIMVYIGFNPHNMKKLWKQILIFYLTSFIFGGVALYLIYLIKPKDIFIKNGIYVGSNIVKIILLGGIVAFIIIKISLKIIKVKSLKDVYCKIQIKLNNRIIETTAMIDTGNFAKEPITNTPVVIVESSLLYEYIPNKILYNLNNILTGEFNEIPEEYISKVRCIPFSSLGRQNGMLLGLKVDEIIVKKDDEEKTTKNVIMAIYDMSFTKRGEYRALIGTELI